MFVFVILGLLVCIKAKGDLRKESLYVKTGTDLLLDVGEPVTLNGNDFMFWKFQNKVNICKLTRVNGIVPNPDYAGKAELFPQNKSLLLKNVQKTDSGEYTAGVFDFTYKVSVKFQVTVLDPVSDVKLEVKQCSSDRSDLTVTCTTLDGRLSSTFICDKTTCSHEGGEPVQDIPSGASMKVYLKNGSVTCHHSNQVSSTKASKNVEGLCRIKKDEDPVSDVKLEVKQSSSDQSDLTVTCTTLDALLSSMFICDRTTCSHEGGEPVLNILPGASVKVYLKNGSVTCHHSNQVSSKEDTKTIEDLCRKPDAPGSSSAGVSLCMLKIIIVSVGLSIMVSAVISVHVMEKLNKTE